MTDCRSDTRGRPKDLSPSLPLLDTDMAGQSISRETTEDEENITTFVLPENLVCRLHPLLQAGFYVKVTLGVSIEELLSVQFGFDEGYISGRITIVFLDHRPVDDIGSAIIAEGSSIGLSAAMPGLVGAAMRRHGFYAGLRNSIAYGGKGCDRTEKEGMVRIKLFNLLIPELGPFFLNKGIYVASDEWSAFLSREPDYFFEELKKLLPEDEPIPLSALRKAAREVRSKWVRLAVAKAAGGLSGLP